MASNPLQKNFSRQNICSNCGSLGHHFKHCIEPVTSYGIIAFHINDMNWSQPQRILNDDLTGIPEKNIEFLLIQRRDSIGYIELLRAKYKVTDIEYIKEQILGTTQKERDAILNKSFDELWVELWGSMSTAENKQHRQEYEQAKLKFEQLKQGVEVNGELINLDTLLKSVPIQWKTPEWGFPKGRKKRGETDLECAMREFYEETNISKNDIKVLKNVKPIVEELTGTNGIKYKHIYYLAELKINIDEIFNNELIMSNLEIGDISFFKYDEALEIIRDYHIEKKSIIKSIINYYIELVKNNKNEKKNNIENEWIYDSDS